MIEVLQAGLLTTIQNGGRRGYEAYGVPRSGAFDPFLAAIANKIAGNSGTTTPLIEFALAGPTLHFYKDATIAIAGKGARFELDGEHVPVLRPLRVPSGSVLRFIGFQGWFGYISIQGGIRTERVLGSASTYVGGKIGKRLEKNEALKIGGKPGLPLVLKNGYWNFPEEPVVYLLSAPHTTLFKEEEIQQIAERDFTISLRSNRMGIRLDASGIAAPTIRRSVPVIPGTVQIPHSGDPIIVGPEGPTTGGYPQMGVISRTSWTTLAGIPPGQKIRFQWSDLQTARKRWEQREMLLHSPEAWDQI